MRTERKRGRKKGEGEIGKKERERGGERVGRRTKEGEGGGGKRGWGRGERVQ